MNEPAETKAVTHILQATLADLAGRDSSFLRLNRDELVKPCATVPTAGRPAPVYDLADIAAFVWDRTQDLSDAECRLIAALTPKCRKPRTHGEQS
ncbi:hypothetical protein D3C76_1194830 [compost metagenome]